MKNKLIKTLILLICLTFTNCVFADVEEEVVVVTNVAYTASVTKKASTESVTMNPVNGSHTGLSTVFTLQTNGGDDHFDYIITSQIDTEGGLVSGYGNDGRLLFAHTTVPPTSGAVSNAMTGTGKSKNVFAYPTRTDCTGGIHSEFIPNYKTYGNCYAITMGKAVSTDVTHTVQGTPCANTYEVGIDEAGDYKATIMFTIVNK